jgi:hypothetical protein
MLVIMVFEMVSNTRELLFLVNWNHEELFLLFFFNFLVIKDILIIKIIIIITL